MERSSVVSVFGGSQPKPGQPAYQEAERMGFLLAEAGHIVMTGGYSGTMEAASKGAKEAGGHVIGVTVSHFETSGKRSGPNAYIDELIRYDTLQERLVHLVTRCDAAVALRGGIGTLSEVALTWSLMQANEIAPKPLILLGEAWSRLLAEFYGNGAYIRDKDMALVQVVRTPEDALGRLRDWHV